MSTLSPTQDKQAPDQNWTACSDEMLVNAAKGGDLAAFNTLCRERYSPENLAQDLPALQKIGKTLRIHSRMLS